MSFKHYVNGLDLKLIFYFCSVVLKIRAPLHKTVVTLQLMVSLQTMVTTIATLLHSQSKSRNQ